MTRPLFLAAVVAFALAVVHTSPPNGGEVYEVRLPVGYGICE